MDRDGGDEEKREGTRSLDHLLVLLSLHSSNSSSSSHSFNRDAERMKTARIIHLSSTIQLHPSTPSFLVAPLSCSSSPLHSPPSRLLILQPIQPNLEAEMKEERCKSMANRIHCSVVDHIQIAQTQTSSTLLLCSFSSSMVLHHLIPSHIHPINHPTLISNYILFLSSPILSISASTTTISSGHLTHSTSTIRSWPKTPNGWP